MGQVLRFTLKAYIRLHQTAKNGSQQILSIQKVRLHKYDLYMKWRDMFYSLVKKQGHTFWNSTFLLKTN